MWLLSVKLIMLKWCYVLLQIETVYLLLVTFHHSQEIDVWITAIKIRFNSAKLYIIIILFQVLKSGIDWDIHFYRQTKSVYPKAMAHSMDQKPPTLINKIERQSKTASKLFENKIKTISRPWLTSYVMTMLDKTMFVMAILVKTCQDHVFWDHTCEDLSRPCLLRPFLSRTCF